MAYVFGSLPTTSSGAVFRSSYDISQEFRKTAPELGIFNRRDLVFFSSKVFSRGYRHFGGEKIEKKTLSKKLDGSPWIHPLLIVKMTSP